MDERVKLCYIRPLPLYEKERPYHIFTDIPKGFARGNIKYEDGPEQLIVDIRGRESEFTLDVHGFAYRPWTAPPLDWDDEQEIDSKYIPAIKSLLSEMLSIGDRLKICEVFDWRMRSVTSKELLKHPARDRMVKICPASIAHVDQSPAGILDRMHRQLGTDVDDLIKKYRVQIFNVWRPLVDVVEDKPLAVCDARTTSRSDLVEVEFINTDYIRRNFMAKYSDKFRFYYQSRMTKDEVCVFKIFDSTDMEVHCVPHCAFNHTNPRPGPPRESIEVRILVMSEYTGPLPT